jgi:hypothetical protein
MFEQTFKNIDNILHKDAGCGRELDYVEQASWVLFLKMYLKNIYLFCPTFFIENNPYFHSSL